MAILLCMAVNKTSPVPAEDQLGCYKRGDVVDIFPDSHEFGNLEVLPPADGGNFARIQITGVTVAQVVNWVKSNWDCFLNMTDEVNLRRRRVRIDVDLLPAGVRQQLNQTGFYANTWANIRDFVRNKITDQTAAGAGL